MKREITTTIEVDGEIYIFRIQRTKTARDWQGDEYISNDLTVTSSPNLPGKIQEFIDVMFDKASQIL